jgi:hypothetical protein
MKKSIATLSVFLCVVLATTVAWACGDKLLHLNRIHHLRDSGSNNAVVIFSRPGSLLENAAALHLEKAFESEGYRMTLVNSDRDLTMAIQAGVADALILDIADVAVVGRINSTKPLLIIPVVAKNDETNEADAKHFAAMIKSPAKAGRFLDAVDRAFDSKQARQIAKLQPISKSH